MATCGLTDADKRKLQFGGGLLILTSETITESAALCLYRKDELVGIELKGYLNQF